MTQKKIAKEPGRIMKSCMLDIHQIEFLKQLSKKTRVPYSVYIREGIDLIIDKYQGPCNS